MQSESRMAARRIAPVLALASLLACASGGCPPLDHYRGAACHAVRARKDLQYGLERETAIDAIGRAEVAPPWANDRGLGPALIRNPFDSQTVTSAIGEQYEVVRYFVEARGSSKCPFVQGELRLEPLIFVEGQLVGWSWSYLSDVLDRGLSDQETLWSFGAFCDAPRAEPDTDAASEAP